MFKKISLLFSLLLSLQLSAQKNVVSLGIIDLFSGNLNLNYERTLTSKFSLHLNTSFQFPRRIPLPDEAVLGIQNNSIRNIDITKRSTTGFSITPSARFYTGQKDAPRGFYYGPYLSYSSNSFNITANYDNLDTGAEGVEASLTGALNIASAGMQIGYQWLIKDRISIDWTIIGLGIYNFTLKGRFETTDSSTDFPQWKEDFDNELGETFLVKNNFSTTVGPDFIQGKTSFIFPFIRANLTVGYAF